MVAGVLEPAAVSCSREHNHRITHSLLYNYSYQTLPPSSPVRCASQEEAAEGKRGLLLEGNRAMLENILSPAPSV